MTIRHIKKKMEESGYASACQISSFGVESLFWNIPNNHFKNYYSYKYIFEEFVKKLYERRYFVHTFYEANGIKPLCEGNKNTYIKFIEDLASFYSYE